MTTLETDTIRLLYWFEINYFKMNADKCKLLITNHENDKSVSVDGNIIDASKSVKLLGIKIDKYLDIQFMDKDKLCVLMKAFIESQFGYCP